MGRPFSQVDVALLKKYDRPGPRYTSYPTAPLFQPAFTAADFAEEIRTTNAPGTNAPANALGDLLRNVLPPPKPATNAPGTNAPAATNTPANALGDLLRNVLPPPKK